LAGAPLEVGSELRPLTIAIHSNYLAFIVLLCLVLLFLLWKWRSRKGALPIQARTSLCSAVILSLGFFLLAVLFARRAFDFASGFGTIMIALASSHFFPGRKWLRIGLFGLFTVLALYGISLRNRVLAIGWQADRMAGAAQWLEANAQRGDIVFNLRWEYFSELFFWNTKNRYIGGMDPIFQYAFDPDLYRAGLAFGTPRNSILCPTGTCPEPADKDGYQLLKGKFKARYVVLLKQADTSVFINLLTDKRFILRHQDENTALFEIP
jgi:hypothetical protein